METAKPVQSNNANSSAHLQTNLNNATDATPVTNDPVTPQQLHKSGNWFTRGLGTVAGAFGMVFILIAGGTIK